MNIFEIPVGSRQDLPALNLKDQYGQDIPDDLVVLPFGIAPGDDANRVYPLKPETVEIYLKADWYEVENYEGLILASAKAVEYESEDNPLDCGFPDNWQELPISRIADPLKRYSWEDGFYHA